jgi:hypothetical protein
MSGWQFSKKKFMSGKMFLTCLPCLYHYKGGLSKSVSVPPSHAYISWCPFTGSGRLSSNGGTTQECCECFVACWAAVCDSCSLSFHNYTWTWTPNMKSIWFWGKRPRTTERLLSEAPPQQPQTSDEDVGHIRGHQAELMWINLCCKLSATNSIFCTYAST